MSKAKILEFPPDGRVILREGDPDWDAFSLSPSPACIAEIEEMEATNRRNVADLLRRHFILGH